MPERSVEFLVDYTTTYTTAQWDRGHKGIRKNPTTALWEDWIFVGNGGAGAWAAGHVIGRMNAQTNYTCDRLPATPEPAIRAAGVAQHAIAAGSYGWVLRNGIGEVLADTGGITQDRALVPGNVVAGAADNRTANTDDSFAFSTETVLATALATCWINCRG